jgi:hypothetical protein
MGEYSIIAEVTSGSSDGVRMALYRKKIFCEGLSLVLLQFSGKASSFSVLLRKVLIRPLKTPGRS